MRSVVVGLILCGAFLSSFAQNAEDKVLRQQITLHVENDVFTSPILDQYYSSGIRARYSRQLDTARIGPKLHNIVRYYELSQKMYTANSVEEVSVLEMDRPYAGILSVSAGMAYYFQKKHTLDIRMELGWMGPRSFTGEVHQAWHQWFGLPSVNGWDSQVSDAPVVNAYLRHGMQLLRSNGKNYQPDILLESELAVGSIFNYLREHIVFRFGRTLPVNLSGFFDNTLGGIKPKESSNQAIEAYIMYSPGWQYTVYNGTLQGGLLSWEPSVFTKEPHTWVYHQKFGLLLRYGTFDFNFVVHLHKPETDGVTSHQYAGFELKQRF